MGDNEANRRKKRKKEVERDNEEKKSKLQGMERNTGAREKLEIMKEGRKGGKEEDDGVEVIMGWRKSRMARIERKEMKRQGENAKERWKRKQRRKQIRLQEKTGRKKH